MRNRNSGLELSFESSGQFGSSCLKGRDHFPRCHLENLHQSDFREGWNGTRIPSQMILLCHLAHLSQVTSGSAYGETAPIADPSRQSGLPGLPLHGWSELLTQAAIPNTQISDQGTVVATFADPRRHTTAGIHRNGLRQRQSHRGRVPQTVNAWFR